MTLTPAQGGLGVPNLKPEASLQYAASKLFTKHHVESINAKELRWDRVSKSIDDLKRIQQTVKAKTARSRVDSIDASLYS